MDTAAQVERARQAWNHGDLDGYLSLYGDEVRLHGYSPEPMDKTAAAGFYQMIWASLTQPGTSSPQLQFHENLVDGNLYACRFTMTGSQNGEFMGFPAGGRPYTLQGMTIMRFDGERVVERWSTADFLGMLMQLGAIPIATNT
jgi:predicted ester cyclase